MIDLLELLKTKFAFIFDKPTTKFKDSTSYSNNSDTQIIIVCSKIILQFLKERGVFYVYATSPAHQDIWFGLNELYEIITDEKGPESSIDDFYITFFTEQFNEIEDMLTTEQRFYDARKRLNAIRGFIQ